MCAGWRLSCLLFFFFNDTATTEIYTLSLHDALPIFFPLQEAQAAHELSESRHTRGKIVLQPRSEEHTSELQSHSDLVCRLLLEKKKKPSPCLASSMCPTSATSCYCPH